MVRVEKNGSQGVRYATAPQAKPVPMLVMALATVDIQGFTLPTLGAGLNPGAGLAAPMVSRFTTSLELTPDQPAHPQASGIPGIGTYWRLGWLPNGARTTKPGPIHQPSIRARTLQFVLNASFNPATKAP